MTEYIIQLIAEVNVTPLPLFYLKNVTFTFAIKDLISYIISDVMGFFYPIRVAVDNQDPQRLPAQQKDESVRTRPLGYTLKIFAP